MRRKATRPNAPLDVPVTSVYNDAEAARELETYREYTLTECERLAYNAKYGEPTGPHRPSKGGRA